MMTPEGLCETVALHCLWSRHEIVSTWAFAMQMTTVFLFQHFSSFFSLLFKLFNSKCAVFPLWIFLSPFALVMFSLQVQLVICNDADQCDSSLRDWQVLVTLCFFWYRSQTIYQKYSFATVMEFIDQVLCWCLLCVLSSCQSQVEKMSLPGSAVLTGGSKYLPKNKSGETSGIYISCEILSLHE